MSMQALLNSPNNQVSHELVALAKRWDDKGNTYESYNGCIEKLADYLVHVGCNEPEYVGDIGPFTIRLFTIKYRVHKGIQHCSICPYHDIYIEINILTEPYVFMIYIRCSSDHRTESKKIVTLDNLVEELGLYGLCDELIKGVVDG